MTDSARKASPLLVLIVICQIALSHAGTPVVIWCPHNESFDHNSPLKTVRSNPLQKLSSEKFEEILSQSGVTDPTIVVAEELCVEDLKNNKVRQELSLLVSPLFPWRYIFSCKYFLLKKSTYYLLKLLYECCRSYQTPSMAQGYIIFLVSSNRTRFFKKSIATNR